MTAYFKRTIILAGAGMLFGGVPSHSPAAVKKSSVPGPLQLASISCLGRSGSRYVLDAYGFNPVVFTFSNRTASPVTVQGVRIRNRERRFSQQLRTGNASPKPLVVPGEGRGKMTVEVACSWEAVRWRRADVIFTLQGPGKQEVIVPLTYKANPESE